MECRTPRSHISDVQPVQPTIGRTPRPTSHVPCLRQPLPSRLPVRTIKNQEPQKWSSTSSHALKRKSLISPLDSIISFGSVRFAVSESYRETPRRNFVSIHLSTHQPHLTRVCVCVRLEMCARARWRGSSRLTAKPQLVSWSVGTDPCQASWVRIAFRIYAPIDPGWAGTGCVISPLATRHMDTSGTRIRGLSGRVKPFNQPPSEGVILLRFRFGPCI